jgi:hypothetical protein
MDKIIEALSHSIVFHLYQKTVAANFSPRLYCKPVKGSHMVATITPP